MWITLFPVLAAARRNLTANLQAPLQQVQSLEAGIKTIPVTGRGLSQVSIRVACSVGPIRCPKAS